MELNVTRVLTRLVAAAALLGTACGPGVDVAAALHLESVATGWAEAARSDAGNSTSTSNATTATNAANKIVPMVSFTVRNASDRTLAPVQINAVFRRVGESSEWSNGIVTAAGSSGLAPASETSLLVIKGAAGY